MMPHKREPFRILLILALLAFFLVPDATYSQESPRQLLLEDAVESALRNNRSLRASHAEQLAAEANFKQTNAFFLPQVTVSYSALTTDNPLHAFGLKLQQQAIGQADFDPARLNHPSAVQDFSAQAQLQQPIINLDLWAQRRALEARSEGVGLQYERRREALLFEVQKAYMEVQMARHSLAFLEVALEKGDKMYRIAQNFVAQGILQKSDELNALLYVSTLESEYNQAKNQAESALERLGLVMGDTLADVVLPPLSAHLDEENPLAHEVPTDRPDYRAMDKALEAASFMVKSAEMSRLPRLNAFASYQFNDSEATGFRAGSYMAGASLSWDIFSGTKNRHSLSAKRHEQEQARLQVENYKAEGQSALNTAYRDLQSARFRISKQEVSVKQAAESLRILENRYAEGLVSTNDLLLAQTRWSQENLSYTGSLYAYNLTLAYLQFLTSSETRK